MTTTNAGVLGTFFGDEEVPIEWQEGERELFWIYDDLHIPNPVSPMFFDIGGWWLTCDHMFRRFGTPFACDWIAKNINGYVYTAAVPADSSLHAEATEYQSRYGSRGTRDPSYPQKIGAPTWEPSCRITLRIFWIGGDRDCARRWSATSPISTTTTQETQTWLSSLFCSRMPLTSTTATGRFTGC